MSFECGGIDGGLGIGFLTLIRSPNSFPVSIGVFVRDCIIALISC